MEKLISIPELFWLFWQKFPEAMVSAVFHNKKFQMEPIRCAKKVVSNSPGLVDFAIGLVNSVFNLPGGQMTCFEEFE